MDKRFNEYIKKYPEIRNDIVMRVCAGLQGHSNKISLRQFYKIRKDSKNIQPELDWIMELKKICPVAVWQNNHYALARFIFFKGYDKRLAKKFFKECTVKGKDQKELFVKFEEFYFDETGVKLDLYTAHRKTVSVQSSKFHESIREDVKHKSEDLPLFVPNQERAIIAQGMNFSIPFAVRFTESGFYYLCWAHDLPELYILIDEFGDPYEAEYKQLDAPVAVGFKCTDLSDDEAEFSNPEASDWFELDAIIETKKGWKKFTKSYSQVVTSEYLRGLMKKNRSVKNG